MFLHIRSRMPRDSAFSRPSVYILSLHLSALFWPIEDSKAMPGRFPPSRGVKRGQTWIPCSTKSFKRCSTKNPLIYAADVLLVHYWHLFGFCTWCVSFGKFSEGSQSTSCQAAALRCLMGTWRVTARCDYDGLPQMCAEDERLVLER